MNKISHITEHNVQWLITDLCAMRKHIIDSMTFTSVIKLIYKLKSIVSNQPLAPPQRSLAVSCALNKEELWKEMILLTPPATQRLIFNTWPFFNISFLSQKPFHGQNAIMHLQNWIMVWLDWKCHQTTGCTCTYTEQKIVICLIEWIALQPMQQNQCISIFDYDFINK